MKIYSFTQFIYGTLLLISLTGLVKAQNELQAKIDSLQVIIDKTTAQDSLYMLLSQQFEWVKQIGDLKMQADWEMKLGNATDYEGFDKERHTLNALKLYRSINDTTGIINALYELAAAKQYQNNYDSTKVFAEDLIELAENVSDTTSIIKGRLMLSSIYNHMSLYVQSLEELNKSRILAEKIVKDQSLLVDILNKESFAYYSLGEYDKSAEKINRIIEIFRKENNPRRLNLWLNNLASVYSLCNGCVSTERRKEILRESIGYSEKANFTYGKGFAYKHLADVYREENKLDSSLYYLNQIEVLLPEINKRDFTALVSIAQALIYKRQGNRNMAIRYYTKAYDIWQQIGKQKEQMDMANNLSFLHEEKGNFKQAYQYLRTYSILKDSLYNADNVRKIKELELNYDFRQRQMADSLKNEERLSLLKMRYEYEASIERRSIYILITVVVAVLAIALLVYSNYKKQKTLAGLLKVKSAQVESELSQKKLLLTEIHHRVKNNFQVLSSLLELQAKATNDPATRNLISEGKSRVKSMALIHSQLYNTDSLKISLKEYIQNLVAEIQKSFEGKTSELSLNIDPDYVVDVDNMVPLGLIANELITNSYKYAAAQSMELAISLNQDGEFHILEFKDRGPGLPEDFDLNKAKSTGIWLVSRLVLQLHGRYEYEYNEGAIFRVYFTQSQFVQSAFNK